MDGRKTTNNAAPRRFAGKERYKLTNTDSRKRVYYGVENEEGYLLVVVVVEAGTRRFRQKISPKSLSEA
jgi:hypothetical protein